MTGRSPAKASEIRLAGASSLEVVRVHRVLWTTLIISVTVLAVLCGVIAPRALQVARKWDEVRFMDAAGTSPSQATVTGMTP